MLPLVNMRRPVATDDGEEEARFTIARIAPGSMPEGRMQFLTHYTEHLVWPEPFSTIRMGRRRLRRYGSPPPIRPNRWSALPDLPAIRRGATARL